MPGTNAGPSAVVFDVGNVLFRWDRRAIYERLIDDDQALDAFLDEVLPLDWHAQLDEGVEVADAIAPVVSRFPQHCALIHAYAPRFNDSLRHMVPGMDAVLAELDAAGVPLFAITNFHHGLFAAFRAARPDVFDRFRDIVVSGDEKMIKPDPAIYHLALARFGLTTGDAFFIDDSAANVASAAAIGIHAHHFRDSDGLRAELASHGLLR